MFRKDSNQSYKKLDEERDSSEERKLRNKQEAKDFLKWVVEKEKEEEKRKLLDENRRQKEREDREKEIKKIEERINHKK
jgi:hypothetical protein